MERNSWRWRKVVMRATCVPKHAHPPAMRSEDYFPPAAGDSHHGFPRREPMAALPRASPRWMITASSRSWRATVNSSPASPFLATRTFAHRTINHLFRHEVFYDSIAKKFYVSGHAGARRTPLMMEYRGAACHAGPRRITPDTLQYKTQIAEIVVFSAGGTSSGEIEAHRGSRRKARAGGRREKAARFNIDGTASA